VKVGLHAQAICTNWLAYAALFGIAQICERNLETVFGLCKLQACVHTPQFTCEHRFAQASFCK
jgi:hypothetical protein